MVMSQFFNIFMTGKQKALPPCFLSLVHFEKTQNRFFYTPRPRLQSCMYIHTYIHSVIIFFLLQSKDLSLAVWGREVMCCI